jgi:hypothetical protein
MQGEWVYTNMQGLVMMLIFEGNKKIETDNRDTIININNIDTTTVCILDEDPDSHGSYKIFTICNCENLHTDDNNIYINDTSICPYNYINVYSKEIVIANSMSLQTVVYKKTKIKKK